MMHEARNERIESSMIDNSVFSAALYTVKKSDKRGVRVV